MQNQENKAMSGLFKENVFIEPFTKRRGGRVYRDVTFHVKGGCVEVRDLLVSNDEKAYEKAKEMLKEAIGL